MFSKKSTDSNAKNFEAKFYYAQQRPDDLFDLSECELKALPNDIFSIVRVAQKPKLFLQHNLLKNFDSGGSLSNLKHIVVLDISFNKLFNLPDNIDELQCLQFFNISNNSLRSLPPRITMLRNLVSLDVSDNNVNTLPSDVHKWVQLEYLNVANNKKLSQLPRNLCYLKRLKEIVLSLDRICYPPSDVCNLGTIEIIKFLCKDEGIDYILDVSTMDETNAVNTTLKTLTPPLFLTSSYRDNETKRLLDLETDRRNSELLLTQNKLAKKYDETKVILKHLAETESQSNEQVTIALSKRQQERQNILSTITEAEHNSALLIGQLLEANEKSKQQLLTDTMMDKCNQLDINRPVQLHRDEILASMCEMLSATNQALENISYKKDSILKDLITNDSSQSQRLKQILCDKQKDQTDLISQLKLEEAKQKEAFAKLQLLNDSRTQQLQQNIRVIQQELSCLTMVERNADERAKDNETNLENYRQELTKLLSQFFYEQKLRQAELHELIDRMEQEKKDNELDFWLIQYQRVLNRKPAELHRPIDEQVKSLLIDANCEDLLPYFQRYSISYKFLKYMTDDDLKNIRILSPTARQRILSEIKKRTLLVPTEKSSTELLEPSCRRESTLSSNNESSYQSPPVDIETTVARLENECSICQDGACTIIFIQCGHVCCCAKCAQSVSLCPLCRAPIIQRIRIQF